MLIETRPEQELAWVALIEKLAPGRFIQLATVEGGQAYGRLTGDQLPACAALSPYIWSYGAGTLRIRSP